MKSPCHERAVRLSLFLLLALALPAVAGSRPAAAPGLDTAPAPEEVRGAATVARPVPAVSPALVVAVGRRIWKNECEGTITGLTSWNKGESFPSLGIGHFIWYPRGGEDRFKESFPSLLAHFRQRGVALPAWLAQAGPCPWSSRDEFLAARSSPRMKELRRLLAATISLQAEFIALRMANALPDLLASLAEPERSTVQNRFHALFQTPDGLYALMDYVNFKGEGLKETERYQGQGWGLLQVLQGMRGTPRGAEAAREFAHSAIRVLQRRVANAPEDRRAFENKWLPGWEKRCRGYLPASMPGEER